MPFRWTTGLVSPQRKKTRRRDRVALLVVWTVEEQGQS